MAQAWIFLLLAIITEVAGTLTMNASGQSGNLWMYALMYLFISSSYILLSFALRRIAVGIAIAIWEGLGTALISLISILFLGEKISTQKLLGLALALLGIFVLRYGRLDEDTKPETAGISL